MRILLVHNRYQLRGGEDVVFDAEAALLRKHGHQVDTLLFDNHSIPDAMGAVEKVRLGLRTVWSGEGHRTVRDRIESFRPEVVHFHNTFPLFSPAAYWAARAKGARVVQTLHNYRLLCANALLQREGKPCEECIGRAIATPALKHRCYRDSRAATAAIVSMQATHRAIGTFANAVDRYIALTDFARAKFIEAGFPADKLIVEPNFIDPDPGLGDRSGDFVLFVGRLSEEKGVKTLLEAWRKSSTPLHIVGDGPLRSAVEEATRLNPAIKYLGNLQQEQVLGEMKQARLLLIPSIWYEGLPRVVVESFAVGLPIVASNIGALGTLVRHAETGMLFAPGDSAALRTTVETAISDPAQLDRLSAGARAEFEAKYQSESHHAALLRIYKQ